MILFEVGAQKGVFFKSSMGSSDVWPVEILPIIVKLCPKNYMHLSSIEEWRRENTCVPRPQLHWLLSVVMFETRSIERA